jgi:hypothetical protein
MTNFFTALGAPEAQKAINTMFTEMEEGPQRREEWGMKKQLFQSNMAVNQNQLAVSQQQLEQHKIQLQKMKEQEEYMNQDVDFRHMAIAGGLEEETADYLTKQAEKMGVVKDGVGKRWKSAQFLKELGDRSKEFNDVMQVQIGKFKKVRDKEFERLEKLEEEGADPASIQLQKEKYQAADKEVTNGLTQIGKANVILEAKQRMRPAMKKMEQDGTLAKIQQSNPNGATAIKNAYESGSEKLFVEINDEMAKASFKQKETTPHWEIVKDVNKIGTTGWMRQDMNNPQNVRPNAPSPLSEKEKTQKPGESYTTWDKMINIRLKEIDAKYKLTDAEATQIKEFTPQAVMEWMNKEKKLSPETAKAYMSERRALENTRTQGFAAIEEGKSPYPLLGSKSQVATPSETPSLSPTQTNLLNKLRGGGISNQPVPFTPKTEAVMPKAKTRGEVIKILKDSGYPETEANIKALMER